MRLCFNTDGLGYMPFEEMLDTLAKLGYECVEIACGNWSKAPHIDLDKMLADENARKYFMDAIYSRGLKLEALNCSGNQLAPNEEGKLHQSVVENHKNFKMAMEEVLIPYWKKTVEEAKACGIERIALENHGCQMVYNPSTLIKLRDAVGEMVGLNFDPSHLMWMGGDPIQAIHKLGAERIYHVHAKDVRIERNYIGADGVLDTKTIDEPASLNLQTF